MTVLPDAPIDAATGLPVPTIAVATEGGVSFIKDDGTVWSTNLGITYPQHDLAFNEDWSVFSIGRSADRCFKVGMVNDPFAFETAGGNNRQYVLKLDIRGQTYSLLGEDSANTSATIDFIGGGRLSRLALNREAYETSMVNYTTKDYNTGWMNGDIKGAFLSDTDTTSLVDTLFNSNSSFDVDVTGVTPFSGATISHDTGGDGGRLKVTSDGTQYSGVYIDYSTAITSGKKYLFQVDYAVGTYAGSVNLSANEQNTVPAPSFSTAGTYTAYLTSTYSGTTSRQLRLRFDNVHSAGEYFFIDNVIIKEVDRDRSVNANPLTINGTITRTPVATGAELVAYSGFSATNYLEGVNQIGSGDFNISLWVNYNGQAAIQNIVNFNDSGLASTAGGLYVSNGVLHHQFGTSGLSTLGTLAVGWNLVGVSRSSGVLSFSINGTLLAYTLAFATDFSTTGTRMLVGVNRVFSGLWQSGLALLRISATAPTAAQIAKIYNDEKVLFQENAAATLYGTSDAVTALAHDSDTDLLHVGTSAGRSVFDGLRRVSNTTTAVGTAISASNGLVVEE
jgi:hypothetical protein